MQKLMRKLNCLTYHDLKEIGPIVELTAVGLIFFPIQLLFVALNLLGASAITTVINIILVAKIIKGSKMDIKPDFKKINDNTKLNNGKIISEKPGVGVKPGVSSIPKSNPIK